MRGRPIWGVLFAVCMRRPVRWSGRTAPSAPVAGSLPDDVSVAVYLTENDNVR